MTCAPGRACVAGRCETVWTAPDGAVFPDQAWIPSGDVGAGEDGGPPPVDASTDAPKGQWYQSMPPGAPCLILCGLGGKVTAKSPEGAFCASGEVRPASAIAAGIAFMAGCPGNDCSAHPGPQVPALSIEHFCYLPDQKQDKDGTDVTVGCFCL